MCAETCVFCSPSTTWLNSSSADAPSESSSPPLFMGSPRLKVELMTELTSSGMPADLGPLASLARCFWLRRWFWNEFSL